MDIRHLIICFALLGSYATEVQSQVYKCIDPKTKQTTYSGTPCMTGDVNRVSITDNAVMDGAAAQREIAKRQADDDAHAAVQGDYNNRQRTERDARTKELDAYGQYKASANPSGRNFTKAEALALARAAMDTQRVDAVEDASRKLRGGTSQSTKDALSILEACKKTLNERGKCASSTLPELPGPAVARNNATSPEYLVGVLAGRSGTIVGGPLNGTVLPGRDGGTIIGGPLNGTVLPGRDGGTIVGGPLNGTHLPSSNGGTIVGGPLNGTVLPGNGGGTIVGGPMNGTYVPGSEGGTIVGGPLNGTYLPPR